MGVTALLLLAASAWAQDAVPLAKAFQVTADPVSPVAVTAGKPALVTLRFHVSPGFHINSNQPGSELLIPTALKLDPPTDIGISKITYPKGEKLTLAIAPDEPLSVYTGPFAVTAVVSAMRSATPGTYKVHGELRYQACNDRACFPPRKAPVDFDVKVRKARAARTGHNPAQSPHVHQ